MLFFGGSGEESAPKLIQFVVEVPHFLAGFQLGSSRSQGLSTFLVLWPLLLQASIKELPFY